MTNKDLEIKVGVLNDVLQELIVTLIRLGVMSMKDKANLMDRVRIPLKK